MIYEWLICRKYNQIVLISMQQYKKMYLIGTYFDSHVMLKMSQFVILHERQPANTWIGSIFMKYV